MSEKLNLFQKLAHIQEQVEKIQKNAKGFNFKYADGETVLGNIRPLMVELKLLCIPTMTNNTTYQIEYTNSKGATVREFQFSSDGSFIWIDSETGEKFEVPWVFSGNNDDASQAQGNALTYNERYFLLKFFKIATPVDDPDAKKTPIRQETKQQDGVKISKEQAKRLYAISKANVKLISEVLHKYGYQKSEEIKVSDYEKIAEEIEKSA